MCRLIDIDVFLVNHGWIIKINKIQYLHQKHKHNKKDDKLIHNGILLYRYINRHSKIDIFDRTEASKGNFFKHKQNDNHR